MVINKYLLEFIVVDAVDVGIVEIISSVVIGTGSVLGAVLGAVERKGGMQPLEL